MLVIFHLESEERNMIPLREPLYKTEDQPHELVDELEEDEEVEDEEVEDEEVEDPPELEDELDEELEVDELELLEFIFALHVAEVHHFIPIQVQVQGQEPLSVLGVHAEHKLVVG